MREIDQWNRLILAIKLYGPKCLKCKAKRVSALFCEKHRRQENLRVRESRRRNLGLKRRNLNAESYHYETKMD